MAKPPKKKKGTTKKQPITPKPKSKKTARITKSGLNLEHYRKAGFEIKRGVPQISNDRLTLRQFYKSEGESSFYSATFFGGVVNVQLIPLSALSDFIDGLIRMEKAEGKFYDKIATREGDRHITGDVLKHPNHPANKAKKNSWGNENRARGFDNMHDTAEELYLHLSQYKRHGSEIGYGGSFEYIQVCFITLQ